MWERAVDAGFRAFRIKPAAPPGKGIFVRSVQYASYKPRRHPGGRRRVALHLIGCEPFQVVVLIVASGSRARREKLAAKCLEHLGEDLRDTGLREAELAGNLAKRVVFEVVQMDDPLLPAG